MRALQGLLLGTALLNTACFTVAFAINDIQSIIGHALAIMLCCIVYKMLG